MGFISFLARRTLLGIGVMWVTTTAAVIAEITSRLGLDQPVLVQYWRSLARVLHLDLGTSYRNGARGSTPLRQALPPTLTVLGRISSVGAPVGLIFSTFVVGLLLRAFYLPLNRVGFHWIQTGYEAPTQSVVGWAGHMILPWITIAALSAAACTRLIRGSLLETLSEDYIRTACAKGLSERRVRYRHAVRAALTPLIPQLGIGIAALAGGGHGHRAGVRPRRDRPAIPGLHPGGGTPVVLAITLIGALFVVTANLIADLFYSVLDPRVQLA